VWLPFQTYHMMVGLGMGFIALTLLGTLLLRKGALFRHALAAVDVRLQRARRGRANQFGWIAAEVGRQPWVVYPSVQDGVRQPDAGTAHVDGGSASRSRRSRSLVDRHVRA
jgi:cytochrome d ubiquinol oxidase subunit I